jgi:hypothetical protein
MWRYVYIIPLSKNLLSLIVAEKVKETKLCFCCLSRDSPTLKECNTRGCKKRHRPLMHDAKRVYHPVAPDSTLDLHLSKHPKSYFKFSQKPFMGRRAGLHRAYAMLDMSTTCSLIQASVANNVGLTGPTEHMSVVVLHQGLLALALVLWLIPVTPLLLRKLGR